MKKKIVSILVMMLVFTMLFPGIIGNTIENETRTDENIGLYEDIVNEEIYCTDFEDPSDIYSNWETIDVDGGDETAVDTWCWTDMRSHSTSHSFHCSQFEAYVSGQIDVLQTHIENTGNFDEISVEFWHWCHGDNMNDYGYCEYSFDGENWNYLGQHYYDTGSSWLQVFLAIPDAYGHSDVFFRFIWRSINAPGYEGWYVDDVCFYGFNILPDPFFILPYEDEMVHGNVHIWAGEISGVDIVCTEFLYSYDGGSRILIDMDYDGTEIPDANPVDCDSPIGDGWSCYWDVTDLNEGSYDLLVRMWKEDETYGEDSISVYVEPTPPIPSFKTLSYDQRVSEEVLLSVECNDENVQEVVYEVREGEDVFWRNVEFKNQHHYLTNYNGRDLSRVACAVTSAAACLKFWNDTAYPDIMKDPETGEWINQSQLVELLAFWAGTDEHGTRPSNLDFALWIILLLHGLIPQNLTVHTISGSSNVDEDTGEVVAGDANFSRYKNELEVKREDVLWGIKWYRRNATTNKFDRAGGHRMVGTGVDNRNATDNLGNYHNVTFMDPWTGANLTVRMRDNGSYKDPNSGIWRHPGPMITVSEKPGNTREVSDGEWILLDTVTDPSGGWQTSWDTTKFGNGVYFLRATMIDYDYNEGEEIIVVHVENELDNRPPEKPDRPSGPTKGKPDTVYTYYGSTTDPDGDSISYLFDWGDGQTSTWTDPIDSGETASASHKWTSQGTYQIKVKARDIPSFEESPWSDPLPVSMPRNRAMHMPFLQFLQQYPMLYQLLLRFLQL